MTGQGRRWRDAAMAAVAGALPLVLVSLMDDGATLRSLLMTVDRQQGYSSRTLVAIRMFSTGLLPTVAVSAWTLMKRPSDHGTLVFTLVASYFAYVLLFRDAHAVTFVMMLCLVPGGLLVAEFLVHSPLVGAESRQVGPGLPSCSFCSPSGTSASPGRTCIGTRIPSG